MFRASLTATVVGVMAVVALAVSVSPASAAAPQPAKLSASSYLFSLNCNTEGVNSGQLFSVDPTNGVNEVIGSGTELTADHDHIAINCAFQPAWDAATNTVFYVASEPQELASALVELDIATGVSRKIADFSGTGATIISLAIGKTGLAYAFANDFSFYTVDLTTAVVTPYGEVAGISNAIYAFTSDPTSGEFFLIDGEGNMSGFEPTTRELTPLGKFRENDTAQFPFSMQIDSAGTFWIESYGAHNDSLLYTVDRSASDKSGIFVASMSYNELPYSPQAILIVPISAPVISSGSVPDRLSIGEAFAFTVTVEKPVGVTYSLTGTLPTGLTFTAAKGEIAGTPTVAGTFTYTITATNIAGFDSVTATQHVVELPNVAG